MQKIVNFLINNITDDKSYFFVPEISEAAGPYTYYCRDTLAIPRLVRPNTTELVEYCYEDPSPMQPGGSIGIFTGTPYVGLKYQGVVYWRKERDEGGMLSVFVNTVRGAVVTINTKYIEGDDYQTTFEIELTDFVF